MADTIRAALEQAANELDFAENALLCSSFHNAASRAKQAAMTARAALSQPEPAGLSDEELLQIAAKTIEPYEDCGIGIDEYEAETECAVEAYGSELIAFARAVEAATLARAADLLAQRYPQPVPVSERLPGPEDCDEEGMCWWGTPSFVNSYTVTQSAQWRLSAPDDRFGSELFWRPAHALPLPGEVEG